MEFTDVAIGQGHVTAKVSGAPLVETYAAMSMRRFQVTNILVSYDNGSARITVRGTQDGASGGGTLHHGWDSANDDDLTGNAAPYGFQDFAREHAEAAGAWVIPRIPAQANGFRVVRVVPGFVQPYKVVAADTTRPGEIRRVMNTGQTAVREMITNAAKVGSVRYSPAGMISNGIPYALLELVNENGEIIESPVFEIPSHYGFVWWSSLLNLEAAASLGSDQRPEDVTVLLPLTLHQAAELHHLAMHTLNFVAKPEADSTSDDRPARAALDTLHRLRELARHEVAQQVVDSHAG